MHGPATTETHAVAFDVACVIPGAHTVFDPNDDAFRVQLDGFRQNNQELISAVTHNRVGGPDALADDISNLAQDCVSDNVTEARIDGLKVVHVDHQECNLCFQPRSAVQL